MQKVQVGDVYGQLTIIQLSAEIKGQHPYHLCQCSCGKQCLKRVDQLRNIINPSWGCLSPIKKKNKIGDKNGLLTIIKAYIKTDGKHSWHLCQCECGNICEVRTDHFRTNENISCGCNYTNAKKIKIGDKYGLLTVIDAYVRNNGKRSWHKCICECGNIREIRGTNLLTGQTTSCGCINSKGEMFIRKILDNNSIKYQQQYYFKDLITQNNKYLYFDFAIFDNDKILFLIEYNGEQHYKPIVFFGGQEQFKKQQSYDNLKIEYCKLNNIPLLIIPYWNFDKLEELILDKVQEVNLNATC